VKRFQDALLNGQRTALGRQLLTLWKMTSLETTPSKFEETLEKTLKAYPAPERANAQNGDGKANARKDKEKANARKDNANPLADKNGAGR
jgi:hypothetical protein